MPVVRRASLAGQAAVAKTPSRKASESRGLWRIPALQNDKE